MLEPLSIVSRIDEAVGKTMCRFPGTDEYCEAAISTLFTWCRRLADTLPQDKREAWACRAYQVADHLAVPEE